MDKILYKYFDTSESCERNIYSSDFSKAFNELGIKDDDTLFIHSDILSFGKIVDISTIMPSLMYEIISLSPKGDILMPTYTYSFTKNETYDVEKTPSTVGSLTNYFRNMKETYRTLDPIFSVSVLGDSKYLECDPRNCFGEKSVYAEILKSRGKIVMLGSKFDKSLTFLHFIEQQFGVHYRKLKKFTGKKKVDNNILEDYCYFYVREPRDTVKINLDNLERYLSDKNLIKTVGVGRGSISIIDSYLLYEHCTLMLKSSENFFLETKGLE
jgi:aminoglycoside 3-N-acetyltransferase